MKNNLFLVGCVSLLTFLSFSAESFAAEATGSLSTPSVSTTVTGGTLSTVATISGTTTAATSVTISTGSNVVFNPTGDIRVTIPASTTITPASGGTFDSTAITAVAATVTTLPAGESSNGALEFGISGVGLRFSAPIRIDIPVTGYTGATIAIKVKHAGSSAFDTTGLTNDPNATCTNGVPSVVSATATVANGVATIYTCQASTFTTYTNVTIPSTSTTGGGGGSYSTAGSSSSNYVTTVTTNTSTTSAVTNPVNKTTSKKKVVVKKTVNKPVVEVGSVKYTKTTRTNIRAAADTKSKFLGYFAKNTKVVVLETSGTWANVKTENISGWVPLASLRDASNVEVVALEKDAMKVPPYEQVTSSARVNVWSAPTTKSKFLGYMGSRTTVTVTEKDATGWVKITSKYFTGWVKASMLKDPQ